MALKAPIPTVVRSPMSISEESGSVNVASDLGPVIAVALSGTTNRV